MLLRFSARVSVLSGLTILENLLAGLLVDLKTSLVAKHQTTLYIALSKIFIILEITSWEQRYLLKYFIKQYSSTV